MRTGVSERDGIRVSVDAVGDAAWALGRSLYDPIELMAPVRADGTSDDERREAFEHNRLVELRLIAQLIRAGRQDVPPLTVRQLLKLARAAGFTRDSGCPHHPEIIRLYDGWPDGPITTQISAYVTADRRVAVLKAELNSGVARRARTSKPDMELIAELLAWPTATAAAGMFTTYAKARPEVRK
jgi:hypothetical protein